MIAAVAISKTPAVVAADIAVIVAVARLMGAVARRLRQPSVIGEVVGGIVLGPTVLGAFPGHLSTHLFPKDSVPYLSMFADIGVVLFMFTVGLELDLRMIRRRAGAAASVSLASIAVPFGFGVLLAVGVLHRTFGRVDGHPTRPAAFALFIGASMSVTAFPVLARILSERGMQQTPIGTLALASAAVDDVVAWSLLALVVGVVTSSGAGGLLRDVGEALAFVVGLLLVVRPLLARLLRSLQRHSPDGADLLAVTLIGLLACAAATDGIGVNFVFGAFVFGVAFPKTGNGEVVTLIIQRIESLALVLLLPIFFVVTGLSVNVRAIGWSGLGYLAAILAVAIGGKFAGASAAARANGLTARQSAAMGSLMNTRGLTELIILTVGHELGVLDGRLFTLLVVMAVLTTVMTEPLLRLVYPDRFVRADLADAERRLAAGVAYRAMVLVDSPAGAGALTGVAADLVGPGGSVVLAHYLTGGGGSGPVAAGADLRRVADALDALRPLEELRSDVVIQGIVRPSADAVDECLADVTRREVDVVLLDAHSPHVGRIVDEAPCHVGLYSAGEGGTGEVAVQEADGDGTAFELGARIAMGRGAPLRLVPVDARQRSWCRRLAQRAEEISLLRGSVTELDTLPEGALVVADVRSALAAWSRRPAAVLAVRTGDDPQRVNLDDRVLRLMERAGSVSRRTAEVSLGGPQP